MKKILGSVLFLILLAAGWYIHEGGLKNPLNSSQSADKDTVAVNGGVNGVDTGNPSSADVKTPAPSNPDGFVPNKDTLKSILSNGVVRVSVENPSRPFYSEDNGKPQGFNVDFANLLFAQKEFTSGDHPTIAVDTHHGVDTYPAVPDQLTKTDKQGNAVVDVAMDGLTFPDNTPSGVVYSIPYVEDFGYSLIVAKGSPVRSASDLAGKTVGVLQGDPDVKAYVQKAFPNSKIVELSDASIEGQRSWMSHFLDEHQVDAIVYDYPFGVSEIKGTDLTFAVTKLDGSNLAYKIGVRKEDSALLIYLNSAIAKVKQSPAYLDLLRKYFISDQVLTTAATGGEKTYVVRSGDTLNAIAASQLGSGARFVEVQKRNNLPNPNLILIGQHLIIPVR
ncbi:MULTISPECIES: transporter substrate-binding and LysM peptidoglycan-binding domain-containing protein [Paraburkholderia]|uniref:transporter substrate-binding and LysM peptidoglycan-binding domain-containing protein n=1 Tax=Paraburkholderia TaxID=1822464 RepID=UPI00211239E8|nr:MULTISPECIES: transporter substrate-binding domain-containing protein [Paraburkholderia]MCP2087114.1 ABC-type amino acid transport substrate-binding protein [Paraburkholderia sediminicola]MCX4139458.1 transporter substrate-binding domain-containing protein [Paraburkholderia aspalathi]MDN7172145.1 transporter substrate-binding domain-containing protein [Paraburkholderia sp. SEWSISQ10-3 4]MDQ6501784.1 transporter substrate-binding domain-containing protein [Paraburkholderia aspalathi]